jgi:hypothetical protein
MIPISNMVMILGPKEKLLEKFHISLRFLSNDYLENEYALDIYDGVHRQLICLLNLFTAMGHLIHRQNGWVRRLYETLPHQLCCSSQR